jgi:hypothetical protein
MSWQDDLLADLDRRGEDNVRPSWIKGDFGQVGSERYSFVERWLRSRADTRKEQREDMSLSISRKALFNSRVATIIASIAMMVAALDTVISFLRWMGVLEP